MFKKRLTVKAAGSVLLLSTLISACSNSGGTSASGNNGNNAKSETPTKISIMLGQQTADALPTDNVVLKEIEKRTNTILELNWVPINNYDEKANVTLASGNMPDLMLINDIFQPLVRTMAAQGAFWDLTPFFKDYKNISSLPKETLENSKINGKNYGIPRVRPLEGGGWMPLVRKDWLDKLGMKPPETMDDMYNVMKAFTEKDPEGNNKNDTYGVSSYVTSDSMGNLQWVEEVFNGTTGGTVGAPLWKLKDGKLTPTALEPGTRDALIWLNKAYTEKLISPDFAIMKPSQAADEVKGGKAGIVGATMQPQWLYTEPNLKTNPKADFYPLPYLTGPFGKWAPKDTGFYGMFVIPKTVPEAKVRKILAFMDYGFTDEGSDLANYGFKDVHYTENNGFKVATEQAKKDMVAQNVLGQLYGKYDKYSRAFLTGIPKEMYDRNSQVLDERAKVSIPDPTTGVLSDTYQKVGKDFDKKIQDIKTKVIMGKANIAEWDAFVNTLKSDPNYQKIIAEMNDSYQKKLSGK
ncbi:extracellular solute-binding protein [Paenibacillus filicis]|uniref:Extracellular solute-binding protein n=1 Tax=Paenibacillus gyeongsangnamensis TaxID=3388067 RepID=A0ABT4QL32_9BACL|nr:extracellular solute-binding protein [Paenibacillus filicis]MCZ8517572.1 extracellular solute-binding protein [Paenibacillus filicis]